MRRAVIGIVVTSLFVWLAPLGAAVGAGSARVSANARFDIDPRAARGVDRPGMAVDRADPRHVVAVDEDFRVGTCNHHVSFDAGLTWSNGVLRAPTGFSSPPCVQFDTGGWTHTNASVAFGTGQNVYTTFSSFRPGDADSILVAHSTDGGRTFPPATVAVAGLPGGRSINIRPTLAVVPRPAGDKIVVVYWACETPGACSGTHRAMNVVSKDSGRSWGSPVFLSLPTDGPAPYPSIPTAGPDGTYYVTFRRTAAVASPLSRLVLATSKDDGASWAYETVTSVTGLNEQKLLADPRDGTLYLAYHAKTFGADPDIVFQRRPAGSTTWSAPLRVNDDPLGPNVSQVFPWLTLGPDGRIFLLWQDRRNSYPGNSLDDYYFSMSNDGGKTFSSNRRVTDRSINLDVGLSNRIGTASFYWPALAVVGGGTVLATWPDSREGNYDTDNQDIYQARVQTRSSGPRPSRAIGVTDRAGLAATLSQLAYPGGQEVASESIFTTPVIVNDTDPAAAEVGAVLARARLGPVLVARAGGLSATTRAEVKRLHSQAAFLLGDESRLSAGVVADLQAAGVSPSAVTRIEGPSPAAMAKKVADLLDTRSDSDRTSAKPAFAAAVIANAGSPEAASASGLAAALRLPYLFVDRDAIPAVTADALRSLNIDHTLVIGGRQDVSDAVTLKLPAPKRLAGADAVATSAAIAVEARERGLPANVDYVADSGAPVDTAVLGAAVSRLGGVLIAAPGADVAAADRAVTRAGLDRVVDRTVVVRSSSRQGAPKSRAPAAAPEGQELPATGGGRAPLAALVLGLASLFCAMLSGNGHPASGDGCDQSGGRGHEP